jgi:tRNA(Ile)-lysidine synthetase-like protein
MLERFMRALSPLAPSTGSLGVCCSGGGDSMALLALAHLSGRKIVCLHVDHAVRPESCDEAQWVRQEANKLQIPFALRTLTWTGSNAATVKSHERLRNRRILALGELAKETGVSALMTAHQADDVTETLVLRIGMSSGIGGLARLIAPTLDMPDVPVSIVRPLLLFRKHELLDFLRQRNQSWIEDPSNTNEKYQRARIRAMMTEPLHNHLTTVLTAIRGEWQHVEHRAASIVQAHVDQSDITDGSDFVLLLLQEGVEASAARLVLTRLLQSPRIRTRVVTSLEAWMLECVTHVQAVRRWSQAGTTVTWRRKHNSFQFERRERERI